MVTYLIRETRPEFNGSRLAIGGGINNVMRMCSQYKKFKNYNIYVLSPLVQSSMCFLQNNLCSTLITPDQLFQKNF